MTHSEVQQIAKNTISFLSKQIKSGISLLMIRRLAEDKMLSLGADGFWYWDIGAFVFSGDQTALSVSGKVYKTDDIIISDDDIITVDLSPKVGNVWGDYARTFVVENGAVVGDISQIRHKEWRDGLLFEEILHRELLAFVKPSVTFEELYLHMNAFISQRGYVNLDFMGNLGHSIAERKEDRIYIEKGNSAPLGSVQYFTFEPHIALKGLKFGYKMENIYFFCGDKLEEL